MKSLLNALQEGRLIELPDSDKEKSLRYLAHLIEAVPDLAGTPELAEAMFAREAAQNTGLGHGVACPHVRGSSSGELISAVGWSPQGIDYGSSDGQPVHLVVMYYIPDSQKSAYLKEISALATAIHKAGGIQDIAKAKEVGAVREKLLDWVSAAIDASIPDTKARMIRLEARQAVAEASPLTAAAALQIVPVLFLAAGDEKPVVLCQNADLAKVLETENGLTAALKQKLQFDRNGWRLVFRSATAYESSRTLYDYLAVKLA